MKVLVVGANGKVARLITKKIKEDEKMTPVAFIRKQEQEAYFHDQGIETIVSSIENPVSTLAEIVEGFDAVVFSAGSGGKTGYDKTLEVDLDGAVRVMEACELKNIKRFIMVSAAFTDVREFWSETDLRPYYIAKHYADKNLKASSLDYTIIRPVTLTDEAGEGKVKASWDPCELNKTISREDVASVLLESLRNEDSIEQVIEISSGEKKIDSLFS